MDFPKPKEYMHMINQIKKISSTSTVFEYLTWNDSIENVIDSFPGSALENCYWGINNPSIVDLRLYFSFLKNAIDPSMYPSFININYQTAEPLNSYYAEDKCGFRLFGFIRKTVGDLKPTAYSEIYSHLTKNAPRIGPKENPEPLFIHVTKFNRILNDTFGSCHSLSIHNIVEIIYECLPSSELMIYKAKLSKELIYDPENALRNFIKNARMHYHHSSKEIKEVVMITEKLNEVVIDTKKKPKPFKFKKKGDFLKKKFNLPNVSKNDKKCFVCKKTGHVAADCYINIKNPKSIQCKTCKKFGHTAEQHIDGFVKKRFVKKVVT